MELTDRKAGILLHPTSLPFSAGIGTIGKSSFAFLDWLHASGMKIWQVLPLSPTGFGDSPYQSPSTFALNPLLIDLDDLAHEGIATKKDALPPSWIKKIGNIDYGAVVAWKTAALRKIAKNFLAKITSEEKIKKSEALFAALKSDFYDFCKENEFWLRDYAAFMSIKAFYDEKARKESEEKKAFVDGMWNVYWEKPLARHDAKAVDNWINSHAEDFFTYEAIQFFAFRQWNELRNYAKTLDIEIIGDIPIFVAPDSCDVWANQSYFQLDGDGRLKKVAGVPPDYFSATGQLWGNPLYDWDALKKDNYGWWVQRVKNTLKLVDYVRLDHFRGFESYWAVPFGNKTAIEGEWLKGPGKDLFETLKKELGALPLIAEDLGVITDEVKDLRDSLGFPGMKIVQFGFDKSERENGALTNAFLPHNYTTTNCVVYTGTHDNDTAQGIVDSADDKTLCLIASYFLGKKVSKKDAEKFKTSGKLCRRFIKCAFSSIASICIVPLQDVYGLGASSRMNTPSTSGMNWAWRADLSMLKGQKAVKKSAWLKELCVLFNR